MKWVGLITDALMAILGFGFLLYGYRLLGKSAVSDDKKEAVRGSYRILGWCMALMGIIALLSRLLDKVL